MSNNTDARRRARDEPRNDDSQDSDGGAAPALSSRGGGAAAALSSRGGAAAARGRPKQKPADKALKEDKPLKESALDKTNRELFLNFTQRVLQTSRPSSSDGDTGVDTPTDPRTVAPRQTDAEIAALKAIAAAFPSICTPVQVSDIADRQEREANERRGYSVVLRCDVCVREQSGKIYRYTKTRYADIRKHFEDHAAKQKVEKTMSPKEIDEWLIEQAHLAVHHGLTFAALDAFAESAAKHGEHRPTGDSVKALAKRTHAAALKVLNDASYVCLAFDGGMWTHGSRDGAHILVSVAHCAAGGFVLPPTTQFGAWTGATIGAVIERIKDEMPGTTLKHFVVDGASANKTAIDALNALANYASEFDPESIVCEDLLPEKRGLIRAMGEQLRQHWQHVRHLLCLGHYVKNRVVDVQKKWAGKRGVADATAPELEDDAAAVPEAAAAAPGNRAAVASGPGKEAAELVLNIAKSLFALDCASSRKIRLQSHIRHRKQKCLNIQLAGLVDARTSVGNVLKLGKRMLDTKGWRARISTKIREAAPHLFDGISLDFCGDNETAWVAPMEKMRDRLDEFIRSVAGQSTAARVATANQTRWHTSTYLAYLFALENLDALQEFYAEENNPTSLLITAALEDPVKKAEIQQELKDYVTSLDPAAEFLVTVSDPKPGMSVMFFKHLLVMMSKLQSKRVGSPGHDLFKLFSDDFKFDGPEPRRGLPLLSTLVFFFHAQFLQPGFAAICAQSWFEMRQYKIDAGDFRHALGFTAEELPTEEFDAYWRVTSTCEPEDPDRIEGWWTTRAETFPKLHKVALYVLRVPCVVTSCDSAISVLGSMFTSQQNRIDTETAAELVALRCNGDVARELPVERYAKKSFC